MNLKKQSFKNPVIKGGLYTGSVKSISPDRMYVQVGHEHLALIYNTDSDIFDDFKVHDKVPVKITSIDKKGRITAVFNS